MPGLPVHASELERLAALRGRAAARLRGTAATKGATARAADALAVLHALASSPATAADALTLLHELQVHQVELDLQAQEMQESRAELESALHRQVALYDHQPAGCFTIDPPSAVFELNQTGADMLGIAREDALGLPLDAFLCADSAQRFRSAMDRLGADTRPTSCRLTLRQKEGAGRPVLASLGADPAGGRVLVTLVPVDDAPLAPHAAS